MKSPLFNKFTVFQKDWNVNKVTAKLANVVELQ